MTQIRRGKFNPIAPILVGTRPTTDVAAPTIVAIGNDFRFFLVISLKTSVK